MSMSTCTWGLR